ncbi:MAG: helix-turn-helix transcriptional regulator [Clostridia bacterium]|nr:helix-turn-helix transcriptional regulator [Clostridia bacterium]
MQTLGERLTRARKARGLTQEQLAESMHCSRQAISHWENGRSLPDVESLALLNQLLGCDLLSDAEAPAAPATTPDIQTVPETAPEQPVRRFCWRNLLIFLSGAAVMCVLMLLFMPRPPKADPVLPLTSPTAANNAAWFSTEATPKAGHSHLLLSYETDAIPLTALDYFPDGVGWLFDFTITETQGVDFTITDMTYTYFPSLTIKCPPSFHYHDEDLYAVLRQDVIGAGQSITVGNGLPKQPLVGLGVCIQGHDATGLTMEFRHFFPFEQELAQE